MHLTKKLMAALYD